jgi:hypothetical protein
MKIQKYKPGKYISSYKNKNNYYQWYWSDELRVKGYFKNGNFIGYQENYNTWDNKGIKYVI